jgi:serine/threonine-protein kinase
MPDELSADTVACTTPGLTPDSNAPLIPPGYEFLGHLGQGGMGVVYKVYHADLNRPEALKMIRAGEFAGPREVARFRFEAEATAGLEHPNIVTVYSVGEVASRPYLTLRWIDGTNLAERLRTGGPLSGRDAALLVEKVARAVHYAHQRGILHRDLKPGNILLDQVGEPYVADFGLARRLGLDATRSQAGVDGTPAYMPPEQTRCEKKPTAAADVYALGVVLYETLTGRVPFPGPSFFEILKQIQEDEPTPPRALVPTVDADLEAICLKCLEKDPRARYQTAQELADDLERYRRGEAVSAHLPGFWDWLGQLLRTQPEPNIAYSWRVSVWFGAVGLVAHTTIFILTRFNAPALFVWLALSLAVAGMAFVLWWYMLRKFRQLPTTEKHSLVIACGLLTTHLTLAAAFVPFSLNASAVTALGLYPTLTAVSGLGLFILGSTNWSRFFPIGLAIMASVPVLTAWPASGPLLYGILVATIMWYWSYIKKVTFVDRAA